jgi:type IV pilus assembly protein PilF
VRRWLLLALVLGLAGCQSNPLQAPTETTGRLGEEQPDSPADVFVALAAEYYRQGQLQPALTNAKKAVASDSSSPDAHTMLGIVYQALDELDLAERHFARAVDLDPRDATALNAYGSLLCGRGRYELAQQQFRQALENPLYQTPWVPLYNAGLCAREAGDLASAEASLRGALSRNPRFAPALLSMARVSYDSGSYLSARAYLERFRDVAAYTAESLLLGVEIERRLGDTGQAASYEMLLRARFPDSEQVQQLNTMSRS